MQNEIILYQSDELPERIEVRLEDETVWLSQQQMADLFGRGRSTITEHITNVFEEGELDRNRTCRKFRQVRTIRWGNWGHRFPGTPTAWGRKVEE